MATLGSLSGSSLVMPLGKTPLAGASLSGLPGNTPVVITATPPGTAVDVALLSSPRPVVPAPQPVVFPARSALSTLGDLKSIRPAMAVVTLPPSPGSGMPGTSTLGTVRIAPPAFPASLKSAMVQPPTASLSPRRAAPVEILGVLPTGVPVVASSLPAVAPMTTTVFPAPLSPRMSFIANQLAPRDIAGSSSYQDLLNNTATALMRRHGYRPIDWIIVKDESGNSVVNYVKAISSHGYIVLIFMDTNHYNAVTTDLRYRIDSRAADIIPISHTAKSEYYGNYVGKGVHGIGLECQGNYCVLTKTDAREPREVNFLKVQPNAQAVGVISGAPIAHPIIRMSEIIANPALVASQTEIAVHNLRNQAAKKVAAGLMVQSELISQLALAQKLVHEDEIKLLTGTRDEIAKLRGFLNGNQMEVNAAQAAGNSARVAYFSSQADKTFKQIAVRNENIPKLLKLFEEVNAKDNEIRALTEYFNSVHRELAGYVTNLGKQIEIA